MPVNITKPALNLRELLAKVAGMKPAPRENTFFFGGDSANTAFPLPRGWKAKNVFVDGAIYRPGASEDYTVTYDGFIHTVSMAVAPAFVDVAIIAETV